MADSEFPENYMKVKIEPRGGWSVRPKFVWADPPLQCAKHFRPLNPNFLTDDAWSFKITHICAQILMLKTSNFTI